MTRATDEPVRVLEQLPDGTVRQQSPLTGTVVWTVPGRSNRPIPSALPAPQPLRRRQPGRRLRLLPRPVPRDTARSGPGWSWTPTRADPQPWRILHDLPAEQLGAHRGGLPALPQPLRDPAVRVLARQPRLRDPGGGRCPGRATTSPRRPDGTTSWPSSGPGCRRPAPAPSRSRPSPRSGCSPAPAPSSPARTTSSPPAGTSSTGRPATTSWPPPGTSPRWSTTPSWP